MDQLACSWIMGLSHTMNMFAWQNIIRRHGTIYHPRARGDHYNFTQYSINNNKYTYDICIVF